MSEMQVAHDFVAESDLLFEALQPISDEQFEQATLFKGWSINRVLQHLHFWNYAVDLSHDTPDKFRALMKNLLSGKTPTDAMQQTESGFVNGLGGKKLLALWQGYYRAMGLRFAERNPKHRIIWAGPDMSLRSAITARLMETWAHGQAVYDVLGQERQLKDYIRHIVVIGVNTFGWSFKVHGHMIPDIKPYLRLTAPSGEIWEWHEPSDSEVISGPAYEFCQVVTQCRNIADTQLQVKGDIATRWMVEAQCFAGGPETPPAKGLRRKAKV